MRQLELTDSLIAEAVDRAREVIRRDANAVLATERALTARFVAAAGAISVCCGKILVIGSGTSGKIAERAAHIFSVAGTPAFSISPDAGLHGGLGVLQAHDIVLAISNSGASSELNEFCRRAKLLCKSVIVITADASSPLAKLADHVIQHDLPPCSNLGGIVATGCSLAAAAITDALAEVARASKRYEWDKVLFTHPAGAVGRDGVPLASRDERGA